MADAATAPEAPPAAATGGRKTGLIIGLTLGGAVLGGLLAGFVIAPRIVARQAPPAPVAGDSAGTGESHAAAEPPAGEHGGEGGGRMVELTNVIVNPAGSQGTRFLMTSVAISVGSEEAQKALSDREVELRDRVTSILESQTLAQLTVPGARDSLKARIGVAIAAMLPPKTPFRVFIPQFVIQ